MLLLLLLCAPAASLAADCTARCTAAGGCATPLGCDTAPNRMRLTPRHRRRLRLPEPLNVGKHNS